MGTIALRFDADAADAERWADALLAAGAQSVDVSDPCAGTAAESPLFGEPGAPPQGWWPVNRVVALFPESFDTEQVLAAVAHELDCSLPAHESYPLADRDWVRATQAQFAPLRVADGLWVVPSWCAPVDAAAVNLRLDPGLAFGTGSHPSTRLCLAWLAEALPKGASVLDYGCGSGILAIAAAKLGASRVVGIDVDPQAILASRENARRNAVGATFGAPEVIAADAPAFDALVANILANPLILLAPALAARVKPGGQIVLSGILALQAETVAAAYAPWFNIAVWRSDEGWDALVGVRREGAS